MTNERTSKRARDLAAELAEKTEEILKLISESGQPTGRYRHNQKVIYFGEDESSEEYAMRTDAEEKTRSGLTLRYIDSNGVGYDVSINRG